MKKFLLDVDEGLYRKVSNEIRNINHPKRLNYHSDSNRPQI